MLRILILRTLCALIWTFKSVNNTSNNFFPKKLHQEQQVPLSHRKGVLGIVQSFFHINVLKLKIR